MVITYHDEYDDEFLVEQVRETVRDGFAGDSGLATIFVLLYEGSLKYDVSSDCWYAFQPTLWWERVHDVSVIVVDMMVRIPELYATAAREVAAELKKVKACGDDADPLEVSALAAELERLLPWHEPKAPVRTGKTRRGDTIGVLPTKENATKSYIVKPTGQRLNLNN